MIWDTDSINMWILTDEACRLTNFRVLRHNNVITISKEAQNDPLHKSLASYIQKQRISEDFSLFSCPNIKMTIMMS